MTLSHKILTSIFYQIDGKAAKEDIKNLTGNASEWGKNRNEMIIINRLLKLDPTLDINDLVEKDFKDLVIMLKDINQNMNNLTKEERKALKSKVKGMRVNDEDQQTHY